MSASAPIKSKVIKDEIWGMIEVDQSCVRLVDCPILQRMRGIRQTGFTYLTYPPAEHSRFTHSLGMMHVISRFLEAMARHDVAGQSATAAFHYWQVNDNWSRLLKHAAILHDIGHLPFSHTSEAIVEADDDVFFCGPISVEDFLFEVEDCLSPDKEIHFAECLSLAILLTPRFRRFHGGWVSPNAPPESILKIGAMIVGLAPEDGMPGLAGIISGPSIDADKVDYINRDATVCGIPIGVDVSRLFIRSAFLTVQPAELQRLRSSPLPPPQPETIFVVNASGLDSIEEISQARTALYHRVYLHQTTRSAERLLALSLYGAATEWQDRARFDPKNTMDVWCCDDFGLLSELTRGNNPRVQALADDLRNRRLPKRACVFGRNYVRMCMPLAYVFSHMEAKVRKTLSKQITGTSLEDLRRKRLIGSEQRAFEREITAETHRVAEAVRAGGGPCPNGMPGIVTVLPMSNLEPNRSDCIVLESRRLNSTAVTSISDEQLDAADIAKSLGYVMTDFSWREIVFVAARTTLYKRRAPIDAIAMTPYQGSPELTVACSRSILLDADSVSHRVDLDPERLRLVMDAADRGGYFNGQFRLAPFDSSEEEIHAAATRLAEFNGQGNWTVTPQGVRAFLEQFPPRFRSLVLRLIREFNILGRTEMGSSIFELIRDRPQPANGHHGFIVGLSPDSGNTARMKLEHDLRDSLGQIGWQFKKTIRDVLENASPGDDVIFCDDNVTSGGQAICQFMAWLGVPDDQWTPEQRQEQGIERAALSKNDQVRLKELRVTIVSAIGSRRGQENLTRSLPAIGVDLFQGLFFGSEATEAAVDLRDYTISYRTLVDTYSHGLGIGPLTTRA